MFKLFFLKILVVKVQGSRFKVQGCYKASFTQKNKK